MNRNKIKGLTIAESLICIVLIGFFSIILVKTFNPPDQNRSNFKNAYYKISSIVSDLINDETLYPYASDVQINNENKEIGNLGFADTSSVTDPLTNTTAEGNNKFCQLFLARLSPYSPTDASCVNGIATAKDGDGKDIAITTNDGKIQWNISAGGNNKTITVDVNTNNNEHIEYSKEPDADNSEQDTFTITVTSKGKIELNKINENDTKAETWLKEQEKYTKE